MVVECRDILGPHQSVKRGICTPFIRDLRFISDRLGTSHSGRTIEHHTHADPQSLLTTFIVNESIARDLMKKGRTMLLTTNINTNVMISLAGNGGVNGGVIDSCSARPADLVERFTETVASKSKRMRQAGRTMLAGIKKMTETAMNAAWQLQPLQQPHHSLSQLLPVHQLHRPDQPAYCTQSYQNSLCGSQL